MGKGASPTRHELEFVYGLLARGCHDTDVLREYDRLNRHGQLGDLPYRCDVRFVRQRRKEFEAAQASLEAKFKTQSVPAWIQRHWDDLAKTAKELDDMWKEHSASGRVVRGYIVDVESAWFEGFEMAYGYQVSQLLAHLKAEFPDDFEEIKSWSDLLRSPLPKGCLHKIVLVSDRRTFEGRCEVCQGW